MSQKETTAAISQALSRDLLLFPRLLHVTRYSWNSVRHRMGPFYLALGDSRPLVTRLRNASPESVSSIAVFRPPEAQGAKGTIWIGSALMDSRPTNGSMAITTTASRRLTVAAPSKR
ncbi:hypothetical protein D9615_004269 [Tricholomella constricta]|uniref:Uncharacterized protein n=1 Tax=Tricholomella constricta TaxID=117010 RepID=A0A8H5HER8_9AGAR|nr:hypothetical protein D9615_004269 [Tricholomella constricta]